MYTPVWMELSMESLWNYDAIKIMCFVWLLDLMFDVNLKLSTHTSATDLSSAHIFSRLPFWSLYCLLSSVYCLPSRLRYGPRESDENLQTTHKMKPFVFTYCNDFICYHRWSRFCAVQCVNRFIGWRRRRRHPTTAEIRRRDTQHIIINKWLVNEYIFFFLAHWRLSAAATRHDAV